MIKYLLLILSINGLCSSLALANESSCGDSVGECSFYACIEAEYTCGDNGYPLAFGEKYCSQFSNYDEQFSKNGRRWLAEAKICLQHKLLEDAPYASCKELNKEAFADHIPCYVESGFCELSLKDKAIVFVAIRRSLRYWRTILSVLSVGKTCIDDIEWVSKSIYKN